MAPTDGSRFRGLKQLDGLVQLCIISTSSHDKHQLCSRTVDSLPDSLEVLEGHALQIAAAATSSDLGDSINSVGCHLEFRKLHLPHCQRSNPSIIASNHLQELVAEISSWSGGSAGQQQQQRDQT